MTTLATPELDWKEFYNLAPDLFCLIGPDGCFLNLNLAWLDQLGWSVEELLGQPLVKFAHPEDINPFAMLSSGKSANFENRYRHKDGSYRWLSWRTSTSSEGLTYATARDITEEQQELEALKVERTSLYSLLDQLPAFLYLQPKDYGVGFYNQRFQEVFGEPQGRRCYETIAGLKEPCPTCPTFKVFDTKTPQIWEWFDNRTGRTYQIYDYPFKDMKGEPQVVEMGLDITAVKQAEAQLRKTSAELAIRNTQLEDSLSELQRTQAQLIQTEKMSSLGQLVAGVAHEINNPINFIHGNLIHANEYIQQLMELILAYKKHLAQVAPELQQKFDETDFDFIKADLPKLLNSMQYGTERIRDIVRSLRTFSRLDEAQMKEVDIHEGIESTLMILGSRLNSGSERSDIKVIKQYGDLPLVECYPGQLNQVFLNILTNAIDTLEEKSKQTKLKSVNWQPLLNISTQLEEKDWIIIRISDNGFGMNETVQQKIFNPFFTTKPVGKGTGLGMSISFEIVTEKHKGKLECYSTVGKGTELVIKIPLRLLS